MMQTARRNCGKRSGSSGAEVVSEEVLCEPRRAVCGEASAGDRSRLARATVYRFADPDGTFRARVESMVLPKAGCCPGSKKRIA
jgi:hypothetical protein